MDVITPAGVDQSDEVDYTLQIPARAEVILAGACVARTVLDKLGCDSLTVSDRGLRHGLLVERFG